MIAAIGVFLLCAALVLHLRNKMIGPLFGMNHTRLAIVSRYVLMAGVSVFGVSLMLWCLENMP